MDRLRQEANTQTGGIPRSCHSHTNIVCNAANTSNLVAPHRFFYIRRSLPWPWGGTLPRTPPLTALLHTLLLFRRPPQHTSGMAAWYCSAMRQHTGAAFRKSQPFNSGSPPLLSTPPPSTQVVFTFAESSLPQCALWHWRCQWHSAYPLCAPPENVNVRHAIERLQRSFRFCFGVA